MTIARRAAKFLSLLQRLVSGLALVALFGIVAQPAVARDLTEAETAALAAKVAEFDAAMRESDTETVLSVVPPRVMAHIAEQNNLSVEQLHEAMVEITEEALAGVEMKSFGMDLDNGRQFELADGTPYLLIPTETKMGTEAGDMVAKGDTLALIDGGVWYLVRVSETQQVEILRQVYPEFAEVAFEPGTIEVVQP